MNVIDPVAPELGLPVKLLVRGDALCCEVGCDVPSMDVHDHEGAKGGTLQLRQVAPHKVHNFQEIRPEI